MKLISGIEEYMINFVNNGLIIQESAPGCGFHSQVSEN